MGPLNHKLKIFSLACHSAEPNGGKGQGRAGAGDPGQRGGEAEVSVGESASSEHQWPESSAAPGEWIYKSPEFSSMTVPLCAFRKKINKYNTESLFHFVCVRVCVLARLFCAPM